MSENNNTIVVSQDVTIRGNAVTVRVPFGVIPANTGYHYSDDNKKLIPTKEVNFFIWSLPAIYTCPFRTPMCEKECYAVKAECYPEVNPARWDNFAMSKLPTFVRDMTELIADRVKRMRKPELIVRIHESGDFYSRRYAMDWLQIVRNIEAMDFNGKKVTFIAYTKSFIYFDGVKLPESFKLRASVWADTAPEQKEIIERNGWPVYTAVKKFTDHDTFHQCRCQDCATCGKCWSNEPLICCEIH